MAIKVPTPVYWPAGAKEGMAVAGTVIVPELSVRSQRSRVKKKERDSELAGGNALKSHTDSKPMAASTVFYDLRAHIEIYDIHGAGRRGALDNRAQIVVLLEDRKILRHIGNDQVDRTGCHGGAENA